MNHVVLLHSCVVQVRAFAVQQIDKRSVIQNLKLFELMNDFTLAGWREMLSREVLSPS